VSRALDLRKTGGRGLPVGNISPVRDFLHVDDVVRAYRLLVERGRPGEVYNVSSGEGRSIAAMAQVVLQKAGVEAALEEKPELMRAVDIPVLVGSAEKLERETGWRPGHTFDDIVEDLIFAATE
jgi:GDP-4-dehydro-6-deoxy-D-mannose reductase